MMEQNSLDDPAIQKELLRFRPTPEDNKRIFTISIFYLSVALFVGVPVWLKTTATYQAPLPFWDIKSLHSKPVAINVPVTIASLSTTLNLNDLSSIQSNLMNSEDSDLRCGSKPTDSPKLKVRCMVDSRQASETEIQGFLQLSKNVSDFDQLLYEFEFIFFNDASSIMRPATCLPGNGGDGCPELPSISTYTVIILPHDVLSVQQQHVGSGAATFVRRSNRHNLAYIIEPKTDTKSSSLTNSIANLFNAMLLPLGEMEHALGTRKTTQVESLPTPVSSEYAHSKTQRLPASTAYDVTVTVMTHTNQLTGNLANDAPPDLTQKLLRDPTTWLQQHVGDVVRSAEPHIRFNIHSQRLYSVDIENLERSLLIENKTYRYYTPDGLSTLVNQLESYLGASQTASPASTDMAGTKPGLHLILLIALPQTEPEFQCPLPLRFHLPQATNQEQVVTNVAVVPQWGGLFSIDATASPCSHDGDDSRSDQLALQLIAVIRSMIGLPEQHPPSSSAISFSPSTPSPDMLGRFEHWELDSWFLRRTVEGIISIRTTMTALVDLLSRFPNLVINDNVATEVSYSVRLWSETLYNLQHIGYSQNGTEFGHIFNSSQSAFESINSAFSDYTLLGRLYFQEDQKFGIYIPLFVPVGIGLFMSTKSALRILFPREPIS